jgi:hypothetical protein
MCQPSVCDPKASIRTSTRAKARGEAVRHIFPGLHIEHRDTLRYIVVTKILFQTTTYIIWV